MNSLEYSVSLQNQRSTAAAEPVAILAHEMRNPIGAIRNAVSLMESAGTLPYAVDQARRLIARQVGQLSVLVEDLLELPNLARGQLRVKREWIDVVPEVEPPLAVPRPKVVRGGLAAWQVKVVLDYIKANLAQRLAVADIASVAGLSPSYFHRAFKRSLGLTVHLYLLRSRVEMAQRLMASTSESLSRIALSCGMSDQSHLTRWFKRVLGQTPSTWRRTHQGVPSIVERRPNVRLLPSTTPGAVSCKTRAA